MALFPQRAALGTLILNSVPRPGADFTLIVPERETARFVQHLAVVGRRRVGQGDRLPLAFTECDRVDPRTIL